MRLQKRANLERARAIAMYATNGNTSSERSDGKRETPATFLASGTSVSYRDSAGMDSTIFNNLVVKFISETESLRRMHKNLIITLDGFTGHNIFEPLQILRSNKIVVVALSAHTSHITHTLDYSVSSPFKSKCTNQ